MNAALVERERVNKRFQGRAWRARPSCSVDLPLDFLVREIGGADVRENFHALEIDQECRRVLDSTLAILRDVIGHAPLQDLLKREIEGRGHFRFAGFVGEHALNEMRSDQFISRPRLGAKHFAARGSALLGRSQKFVFLPRNQGAARGTLRNQAQRGRFRSAQTRWGLAEVDLARRAGAFDVSAIGREVQVGLEDFLL